MKILFLLFFYLQFLLSYSFEQNISISEDISWSKTNADEFVKLTRDPILNYLSKDYNQDKIFDLVYSLQYSDDIEKIEIKYKINQLCTSGFLSFAKDLSVGLFDWEKFQEELSTNDIDLVWEKNPKEYTYIKDLKLALKTDMLTVLFYRYQPPDERYKRLIKAYQYYENIKFTEVDYGSLLKIGDYGYRSAQLKKFLSITGDLKSVDDKYLEFPRFDKKLENALKVFQKRHYLKVTGELDRVSVLYTKTSAKEKLQLIKLNIERFKLYPRIYEGEYLLINIPEFSLKYFKYTKLISDIFVVIGREDRPTPIFSDFLEYIVLNPSWIIPQGLIRKDYLPQLIADPYSLVDEKIFIHQNPSRLSRKIDTTKVNWEKYLDESKSIPYYFMQYPGESNVLGEMKFIFPNKYKVYLHDTNSKSLTTLKYRLYSSGCIRLSKPYELLSILSENTKLDMDKIMQKLETKKTVNLVLKKKIPIHIRYNTVFVNDKFEVEFRKDFYGFDKIQLEVLK